ncbi:MAG TPA: tRNA (N(6)-L-threonylcarbamoyladenosine(37)-C(2))-methylthiotransferase MtaB [Spirochaetota bacterium]|nr:tRNA (N(6)-L-threonylcarbamoyladenosine(37)-C(2))-methylthiotransferase MtaB [Spirochaetota bacterium]HOM09907.1 tRNA (N(6)-L-threonylcarbamoyladenosine(37)-C(2))-methylthiotransferase MtaB [Spirochaetota bacterium]HPP48748.1 tRNA (N(6)-L-threonylcarbamoyladenosine(37)-C(2))-methylthiotransferase MtaB [Spirochaetota bacterium]
MYEKTFSIKTLGCKCNQYESAQIASQFLSSGFKAVPFGSPADIVIINTCTVTDKSNKKCRNYIRQGSKFSKTGKVIVTGCMVETHKDELDAMNEVQASFTNMQKDKLVILSGAIGTDNENTSISTIANAYALPFMRTRGYIKIQDGCDGGCSYCIVPKVRGNPTSRPVDDIVKHAQFLIERNCPEIVLTGITIGKYQYNDDTLASLIKKIITLEGNFRVRVTSVEPTHVSEELIDILKHDKVCKHIHLPLQSGSDPVLMHMNRPYSVDFYTKLIDRVRTSMPEIAIGTDIIVGYPTESDEDFEATVTLLKQISFAYVHQFSYSPREGTLSSNYRPLPYDIIHARAQRLRDIARECSYQYRLQFLNTIRPAVIEKDGDGITALTDNYLKVALENNHYSRSKLGSIVPVMITSVSEEKIEGSIEL